jgi:hypothetical protein
LDRAKESYEKICDFCGRPIIISYDYFNQRWYAKDSNTIFNENHRCFSGYIPEKKESADLMWCPFRDNFCMIEGCALWSKKRHCCTQSIMVKK